MFSLIGKWQESNKAQQSFCQEHDITFTTFYYWLRLYRREIDESIFLPVEISSGTNKEIRYPDGKVLQLPAAKTVNTVHKIKQLNEI